MSLAEIKARAKKKAATKTGAKRKPASKCSSLVRKRDSLNERIKMIEKANGEALKREQDRIEARHQAQHKRIDAEKAKELEKLAAKYGQACIAKPRKPRSDKGKGKGKRGGKTEAAPDNPAPAAPAANKRPRAKKAAKAAKKAEAPASDGPGVFGEPLTRGQLLTTDSGVTVRVIEDATKADGPMLVASSNKDTLTRGSFNLSGAEFGGITMVFRYAVRTVETPRGYSSSARVQHENHVILERPDLNDGIESWLVGVPPREALAMIRPLLFDAAAKYYRELLRKARKNAAAKQKRREEQQELPCPGGC